MDVNEPSKINMSIVFGSTHEHYRYCMVTNYVQLILIYTYKNQIFYFRIQILYAAILDY